MSDITRADFSYLQRDAGMDAKTNEGRIRSFCSAAYEAGVRHLESSEEVRDLQKNIAYVMGQQWPRQRPTYKAAPVNNRLLRQLEEVTAVLTDARQTYEVKSLNGNYANQAEGLTKTNKAWWSMSDNDFWLAMACMWAYISTGWLRIGWNSRLRQGAGDIELMPYGINSIMPIAPSFKFQDWGGMVFQTIRPITYFMRRFPRKCHLVQPSLDYALHDARPSAPSYMTDYAFNQLSLQMQRLVGTPATPVTDVIPFARYAEFWIDDPQLNTGEKPVLVGPPDSNWAYMVQPGGYLFPRKRLIITGGPDFQIMYDGPNPFWHGLYPYVPLRLKPVPWQFPGISEVKSKMSMQDVVNTILAGVLDQIKKALNPPLLYPMNSISQALISIIDPNMPGAKIGYDVRDQRPPEYAKVSDLPSYISSMLMYAQNEMDDDSGLLDLAGLSRKKISPSGDTLEQLKESQQTIMRLRGRNMEIGIKGIGEQNISNFYQFYDVKRRLWMLGADGITFEDVFDWDPGTMIPAGMDPRDHIRSFVFLVAQGSMLSISREKEALTAFALRRQQDMSRRGLYRKLGMEAEYDRVIKELRDEDEELMARMIKQQMAGQMMQLQQLLGGATGKGSDNVQNLLKVA